MCPLVLALNMMDIAEKRRFRIDSNLLAKRLGCPVIPMSAHQHKGVQQLKDVILRGNIPVMLLKMRSLAKPDRHCQDTQPQ
ncbi:MAG: FeoB small GTPase domain-containing protein [Pseudanabaenaceae cyanobacterium]